VQCPRKTNLGPGRKEKSYVAQEGNIVCCVAGKMLCCVDEKKERFCAAQKGTYQKDRMGRTKQGSGVFPFFKTQFKYRIFSERARMHTHALTHKQYLII
jgi:hypothetical protein